MRIAEKCPCGGQIEAESQDEKIVQRIVDKWRRRHNHFTRPERPVPYWPTTVTWTNTGANTNTLYAGTTSAVTSSRTHDKG